MKDYLIFYKNNGVIRNFVLEDITYVSNEWNIGEPDSLIFHKITGTTYTHDKDRIIKLYTIQYAGDEVILKHINVTKQPDVRLKCYFAHSWRSKNDPDKFRIISALNSSRVDVIDPFEGEDKICAEYGEKDYYPGRIYKLGRAIWIKDLAQIREADIFLMWINSKKTGRYMGVSYELAYAFGLGKHIQIISDLRHPYMAYVLCDGNRQYDTIEDFENSRRIRWK